MLGNQKAFPIQRIAAMSRDRWCPEMFPGEIKWKLAQAVAEVDFKMQQHLLQEGMVGVEPTQFTVEVRATRRAISAESGLQEGDAIRDDVYTVVVDVGSRNARVI